MEILILIAVIIWGFYQYKKITIRNGGETVQAYLFLYMVEGGTSPEEARAITNNVDVVNLDTQIIRDAMAYVRETQGGMQFPMIRTAYAKGMTSKLPGWYRALAQI